MWKGWISAHTRFEREHLESLGVRVGNFVEDGGTFEDCLVSDEALEKLNPEWGERFWSLDRLTKERA